jgi:hypothetical protein
MQFQTRARIALRHYACVVMLQIPEQNRVGANALSTPMTQIDSTHRRARFFIARRRGALIANHSQLT